MQTEELLEEVILIRLTDFIVTIVLVAVAEHFILNLFRLSLCSLILSFSLPGLSFDFTLGLLNLFVLDHIHYLDQIRYGVIVQDILAALNAFLQKGGCKMGLTVGLSREKGRKCGV